MATFKCKMCGGMLEIKEGKSIATCDYCGSEQTVGTRRDDATVNMYNRATNIRMKNDFDKAREIYEKILDEDDTDAEAHWGVVLCKYGIEYVEDPKTHNRIPTCHRTLVESVTTDVDYLAAMKYGDVFQRQKYEEEAKKIAELQNEILSISQKEKPFDVFICYKEKDEKGNRTQDSVLANDIYYQLTQEGLRVFYAAVTLEDKLGTEYEPYIYAALHSAKVMLVIGTKPEYFNAVWVKNEWSRFLVIMKSDRSRTLIPCFRDMDAYDLPEEFAHLQAQDMSKIGFINDIVRGIRKLTAPMQNEKPVSAPTTTKEAAAGGSAGANIAPLLKRVFMFLEDGDWGSARSYCNKVLDIDPECGEAYLGEMLADMELNSIEKLADLGAPFHENEYYKKIMRYGSPELRQKIEAQNNSVIEAKAKREERLSEIIPKKAYEMARVPISAGCGFTGWLSPGGTVRATGYNYKGRCNVEEWQDIIAISAGNYHTVGLKSDGTVVAVGDGDSGKCRVSDWKDIVAVSAGSSCTAGLRSDGTVVSTRGNTRDWRDIVAISCGYDEVYGLRSNGTVVRSGGQYPSSKTDKWFDIVAIFAEDTRVYGLKSDGTVVTDGAYDDVLRWRDITAISAVREHVVGLKSDGTVVATGGNKYGQCDVSNWRDIIAVSAGSGHTIGLKSDGSVVTTGSNSSGQCNINGSVLMPTKYKTFEEEQIAIKKIAEDKRRCDEE